MRMSVSIFINHRLHPHHGIHPFILEFCDLSNGLPDNIDCFSPPPVFFPRIGDIVIVSRPHPSMESMRSLNTSLPGTSSQRQTALNDSPEQLLDAFKAAALSVTKLYKTSAASQTKARLDGYQDCLDDLLAFLDRENLGVGDGEGWRIRKWATERLDGRESPSQAVESDDEAEKAERASSPDLARINSGTHLTAMREENRTRTDSAPPTIPASTDEPASFVVPSLDAFTFQSSHHFPAQDTHMNIANLDLSDSRSHDSLPTHTGPASANATTTRTARSRQHPGSGPRLGSRQANQLGRVAGSKRKLNFAEIFDLGSLGYDKNMFGPGGGGKRSRHI
ncbi:hypothetical protein SODALDRAFT_353277 [Sodiomyces alkalinus F11]|uniref:Uncharacterized protein n=1 Tax=Sodiomyces alkalinus (strain CBS 110278 / VKM F-3762 / F11) TaxID=1314773 RepID=A0A3N2PMA3_SODAK|nr:hypothetical protein SODALDRAFT_353277 [Sodiomyces alkalinus F11]ROT35638.1 hypothetical protein SODALDRAFT_353277 [Sodiomyces alkalinus F11]